MNSPENMGKTYAEKKQSNIERGMGVSRTEKIINSKLGEEAAKEISGRQLKKISKGLEKELDSLFDEPHSKKESKTEPFIIPPVTDTKGQNIPLITVKTKIVKSKNVLGKSATAIRRSTDAVKNMANEGSDDNVILERSYSLASSAAKTTGKATKGLVKSSLSVASIESSNKIRSKYIKNDAVKKQIAVINGVKKTEKKQRNDIHSTYGTNKSEKIFNKKNKKVLRANKKILAKENEKINRKAFIKDYTRKKIINNLVKPESDKENNMSTGFGLYVATIAKRWMNGVIKAVLKALLGALANIFSIIVSTLITCVITILPIIIPIAVVIGVVGGFFSFLFGDISSEQADESYCVAVLSSKYDEFNRASKAWIDKSTVSTTGGTTYSIEYVNGCAYLDNFQDALLLYVVLSADNYSSGTTSTDNSYLVVDTDEERAAMNKAFSMLTYAEESGVVRKVTRLTLADVESQLTADQKKLLELERNMAADSQGSGLGNRVVGEYGDNVGAGSNVAVSPNASKAVEFAKSKVGNPYSQAQRNDGYHFDCSSLVYYAWKEAGVNISPGSKGAGTTETEAKWAEENGKVISTDNLQPGDLIFLSTKKNGRYKNITHVVMYIGDNQVVHASSPKSGVKISKYNYWKPEQFVEAVRPN